MQRRNFVLFIVLLVVSIVGGTSLSRLHNKPSANAAPQSEPVQVPTVAKEVEPCYPQNTSSPELHLKTILDNVSYHLIFAQNVAPEVALTGSKDHQEPIDILFKVTGEGSSSTCEVIDRPLPDFVLSPYLPKEAALDLKTQYWQETFKDSSEEEIKKYLNTPYDPIHPLFFLPEDVEALSKLGHQLGPKALVANSSEEAWKSSKEYKIEETQKK